MNLLAFFFCFMFLAMLLLVIGFFLAGFKSDRFNNDCIFLEERIKKAIISQESYDEINQLFNELDPISEDDYKRKKSLWSGFQYRFKELSPYVVKTNEVNLIAS